MVITMAVFGGVACQPVPVVPGLPTTTTTGKATTTTTRATTTTTRATTTTIKATTTTTKPATSTSTTLGTTTTTLAPPPLAKAYCASGSTITVNTSIVTKVQALLDAAVVDSLSLCGGGYRSNAAQISLRIQNCGPTYYDIYVKPASQCTPPTAIPGYSLHEKGLAIDFYNCSTHTTACWIWLNTNAATYGLKNLASEPWHWSTTGG